MKRAKRGLFWAGLSAGAVVLLFLNAARDLRTAAQRMSWFPVEKKTLYRSVSSPGILEAVKVTVVKSQVRETVLKIHVAEGQAVKQGQLLMELSTINTQLEFDRARTSFANAETDYRQAVRNVAIQRNLYRNKAVPLQDVERAEDMRQRSLYTRDNEAQTLEIVKRKLASVQVKAPQSGVVLKLYVSADAEVGDSTELVAVGDISRFVVKAKVDELEIEKIRVGQSARIQADAFQDRVLTGKLTHISPQAERETFAKIPVVIDVDNPERLPLRHNLTVRVSIVTEEIPEAIGIPAKVVQRKEGDTGWVVARRGWWAREKPIRLGRMAGDEVEVLAGLKAGDQVGLARPAAP